MKFFLTHSRLYDKIDPKICDLPLIFQGKSLDDFGNDYIVDKEKFDFILIGHTHEQLYINTQEMKIINPGSLGCSKEKSGASFCLINFETENLNLEFKNLSYNQSKLREDFIKKDVPDKEFIIKNFYQIKI